MMLYLESTAFLKRNALRDRFYFSRPKSEQVTPPRNAKVEAQAELLNAQTCTELAADSSLAVRK